jgi:hypothetical protein
MTAEQQMIQLNHKIGRDEAVLDCMNSIEAMQELLYQDMEARQQQMRAARLEGYNSKLDPVIIKLRAQIDILYVMHKKFVSL